MAIVNIYTALEKKQSIINKTLSHNDIVQTPEGFETIHFIQRGNVIATEINKNVVLLEKNVLSSSTNYALLRIDGNGETKGYYSLVGESIITISNTAVSNIQLTNISSKIIFQLENDELTIYPPQNLSLYVNNIARNTKTTLKFGDVVDIFGVEMMYHKNTLEIIDRVNALKRVSLNDVQGYFDLSQVKPEYKRSPRIIYEEPIDDIDLSTPPSEPTQSTESFLKILIPPIAMVSATVITGILMNRGPLMFVMILSSLVTVVFSITNYFKQRKEHKIKLKQRIEVYTRYLRRKLSELSEKVSEQAFSRNYHYPESAEIVKLAQKADSRMYEKTPKHDDYLSIRIGTSKVPLSFNVKYSDQDFSEKEDELVIEAKKVRDRFKEANMLPRTITLTNGAIGLLGNDVLIREQLTQIINQIAYFHSYHDVEIIHVHKEDERKYWQQFDFLPHLNSKLLHCRTNIFNERTRDQILSGFFQVIKQRQQQFNENQNGGKALDYTPSIIFIVSDMKQIIDHSIMEYLSKDVVHLGIHIIFCETSLKHLPEYVKTVIEYRNDIEGNIIIEDGERKDERLVFDHLPKAFDTEVLPRILAGYEHVKTLHSSIPEKVGYLQMFGVETVESLNVSGRWSAGEPRKTLAVPLGYRGPEDIVYLNLHEKAHGPHGLVAGTTGSGKSEIVQSYILSLATCFHPHDVGFLLIDYKGGGMANLFKDLPHLLGTITNLDGSQSMRALTAIKAELLLRQQQFSDNDVNHIDGYQKLFKEGKVSEPMPHLFMISDEFAELKSEQPEFMKELVSTARIGRSLGIHLILATQKPAGVVDDQIWSNSKFKLCLKVQNIQDSNEMLKTPDAAAITQPGRAYLQVGNNEIYELFQSAYSGAPYMAGEVEDIRDMRIYEINELGQYDLKTQDLSKGNLGSATIPELDAVVAHIKETFDATGLKPVPSPWLEPLSEFIPQSAVDPVDVAEEWAKFEGDHRDKNFENQLKSDKIETVNENEKTVNLTQKKVTDTRGIIEQLDMIVGVTDEPQNQAQNRLTMNVESGHIGVFGASGFGKTTFIQSMIMSLSRHNTPDAIHFYILDFGQGLLPLKDLPQVADLISIDEEEKIAKWTRLMLNMLKTRKRQFKDAGVADIHTYRDITGQTMHRIITVLDNFDALKDAGFSDEFEKVINMLSREGVGLGLHLIIGASRSAAMKYQLIANIKEKVTFFQLDPGEIPGIMGRTQMKLPEIPGRGLVKLDELYEFQAAVPTKETSPSERIKSLRVEAKEMRNRWNGELPTGIPVVPEVLTMEAFKAYPSVKRVMDTPHMAAVGLDLEKVEAVTIDFRKTPLVQVLGNKKEVAGIFRTISETIDVDTEIYVIDSNKNEDLDKIPNIKGIGHTLEESLEVIKYSMRDCLNYIEKHEENHNVDVVKTEQPNFNKTLPKRIIFISDIYVFNDIINPKIQGQFSLVLEHAQKLNISFAFGSETKNNGKGSSVLMDAVKEIQYHIAFSKVGDIPRMTVNTATFREANIFPSFANIIVNGQFEQVKITEVM